MIGIIYKYTDPKGMSYIGQTLDECRRQKEFMDLNEITDIPQDMYGGIVKERLENEPEFKQIFNKNLEKILTDE